MVIDQSMPDGLKGTLNCVDELENKCFDLYSHDVAQNHTDVLYLLLTVKETQCDTLFYYIK